jgi:hypothetical protein
VLAPFTWIIEWLRSSSLFRASSEGKQSDMIISYRSSAIGLTYYHISNLALWMIISSARYLSFPSFLSFSFAASPFRACETSTFSS